MPDELPQLHGWQFRPDTDSPGLHLACTSAAQREAIMRALGWYPGCPEYRSDMPDGSQAGGNAGKPDTLIWSQKRRLYLVRAGGYTADYRRAGVWSRTEAETIVRLVAPDSALRPLAGAR